MSTASRRRMSLPRSVKHRRPNRRIGGSTCSFACWATSAGRSSSPASASSSLFNGTSSIPRRGCWSRWARGWQPSWSACSPSAKRDSAMRRRRCCSWRGRSSRPACSSRSTSSAPAATGGGRPSSPPAPWRCSSLPHLAPSGDPLRCS